MSIRWQDLDLSEESLPDVGPAMANITGSSSGKKDANTLFVAMLMRELDGVSNEQLEKGLHKYRKRCSESSGEEEDEYDRDEDQVVLATMVLESMLREILEDDVWWQLLKKGGKERRVGYGGINKFIAELRVVSQSVQASKLMEEQCDALVKRITEVYQQFHPEKKVVQASKDWMQGYITICTHQQDHSAIAASST